MAVPVVPSWALNDPITSAKLQQMCDALTWLLYKPHGTYSQTGTAQTIATGVPEAIAWNVNVRQYKITHSTVTNPERIRPDEPGVYYVEAKVEITGDADGKRKVWARQNGSGAATEGSITRSDVGTDLETVMWAGLLYFSGNDYVEIMYEHTGGNDLDLGFGEFNPRLDIAHLSLLV